MTKTHNKKSLKRRRQFLRNNGTSAEAALWTLLSNKQLDGRKFRRQHSVGNYILDFFCPAEKLAIELDGDPHFSAHGLARDEIRDKNLAKHGIKVIHIENEDVFQATDAVLEKIRNALHHP